MVKISINSVASWEGTEKTTLICRRFIIQYRHQAPVLIRGLILPILVWYWFPDCWDNITLPVIFRTESNSYQCPWWNCFEFSPRRSVFPVLCDLWPQPEPRLTQHGWHGDGSYVRAAFQLFKCWFLEGSLLLFYFSYLEMVPLIYFFLL